MLLQRRSLTKITFPGIWSNSCCSHPHFNKYEMERANDWIGIKRAAVRKLEHELGIDYSGSLHVMGRFIYQARYNSEWGEHELDYAIIAPNYDNIIKPNPEEVSDIKFVNQTQLLEMMRTSADKFSPWFKLLTKFDWLNSWWSNLDNLEKLKDDSIHKLN